MSAVSELKTMVSIKDNVSAGLKSIQKEQLRIKKEIQETKEMLKDTFGKKWSIKLQSIELLRYLRDIGAEIRLLRKQPARMLKEIDREKTAIGTSIIMKSTVERHLVETHTIEKLTTEINTIDKPFEKGGNKYDIKISSGESPESKLVGDIVKDVVSKGAYELFDNAAKLIGGSISIVGKIGASLLGLGVSEEIKYIMKDMNKLEMAGAVAEQQDLYMERAITISDPSKSIDEIKKQRDEYMKLLRTNSEDAGFKPSEVLNAGEIAVKIADGDIYKAMDLVRVAEGMTVSRPGSTITESIEALAAAKIGDTEGLKSFRAQISTEELANIGFEGVVRQKLKPQFIREIQKHRNSDAGVKAAEEAFQENSEQRSGKVMLENKRRKEVDQIRRMQEYRQMSLSEKVNHFRQNVDGQHKRVIGKNNMSMQSENKAAINEVNELTAEKMRRRLVVPAIAAPVQSNSEASVGGNKMVSNQTAANEVLKTNSQNCKSTIQNQTFNININAVKMTIDEIVNEVVPRLKLALSNATTASA